MSPPALALALAPTLTPTLTLAHAPTTSGALSLPLLSLLLLLVALCAPTAVQADASSIEELRQQLCLPTEPPQKLEEPTPRYWRPFDHGATLMVGSMVLCAVGLALALVNPKSTLYRRLHHAWNRATGARPRIFQIELPSDTAKIDTGDDHGQPPPLPPASLCDLTLDIKVGQTSDLFPDVAPNDTPDQTEYGRLEDSKPLDTYGVTIDSISTLEPTLDSPSSAHSHASVKNSFSCIFRPISAPDIAVLLSSTKPCRMHMSHSVPIKHPGMYVTREDLVTQLELFGENMNEEEFSEQEQREINLNEEETSESKDPELKEALEDEQSMKQMNVDNEKIKLKGTEDMKVEPKEMEVKRDELEQIEGKKSENMEAELSVKLKHENALVMTICDYEQPQFLIEKVKQLETQLALLHAEHNVVMFSEGVLPKDLTDMSFPIVARTSMLGSSPQQQHQEFSPELCANAQEFTVLTQEETPKKSQDDAEMAEQRQLIIKALNSESNLSDTSHITPTSASGSRTLLNVSKQQITACAHATSSCNATSQQRALAKRYELNNMPDEPRDFDTMVKAYEQHVLGSQMLGKPEQPLQMTFVYEQVMPYEPDEFYSPEELTALDGVYSDDRKPSNGVERETSSDGTERFDQLKETEELKLKQKQPNEVNANIEPSVTSEVVNDALSSTEHVAVTIKDPETLENQLAELEHHAAELAERLTPDSDAKTLASTLRAELETAACARQAAAQAQQERATLEQRMRVSMRERRAALSKLGAAQLEARILRRTNQKLQVERERAIQQLSAAHNAFRTSQRDKKHMAKQMLAMQVELLELRSRWDEMMSQGGPPARARRITTGSPECSPPASPHGDGADDKPSPRSQGAQRPSSADSPRPGQAFSIAASHAVGQCFSEKAYPMVTNLTQKISQALMHAGQLPVGSQDLVSSRTAPFLLMRCPGSARFPTDASSSGHGIAVKASNTIIFSGGQKIHSNQNFATRSVSQPIPLGSQESWKTHQVPPSELQTQWSTTNTDSSNIISQVNTANEGGASASSLTSRPGSTRSYDMNRKACAGKCSRATSPLASSRDIIPPSEQNLPTAFVQSFLSQLLSWAPLRPSTPWEGKTREPRLAHGSHAAAAIASKPASPTGSPATESYVSDSVGASDVHTPSPATSRSSRPETQRSGGRRWPHPDSRPLASPHSHANRSGEGRRQRRPLPLRSSSPSVSTSPSPSPSQEPSRSRVASSQHPRKTSSTQSRTSSGRRSRPRRRSPSPLAEPRRPVTPRVIERSRSRGQRSPTSGDWPTTSSRSRSPACSGSSPRTPRTTRHSVPSMLITRESVHGQLFESEASDYSAPPITTTGEEWSAEASRFSSPSPSSWSSAAAAPARASGTALEVVAAAAGAGGSSSSMSLDSSLGHDQQAKSSVNDLLLGLVGSSLILQREALSTNAIRPESSVKTQTCINTAEEKPVSESSLDMVSTAETFSVLTSGATLTELTELTEGTEMTMRASQTEQKKSANTAQPRARTDEKERKHEVQPDERKEEGKDIPEQQRRTSAEMETVSVQSQSSAAQPASTILVKHLQSSKPSGVALACAGSNTDSGVFSESSDNNNSKGISSLIPTGLPGIFAFPVAVMSPVALLIRSVIKDKSAKTTVSNESLSKKFTGGAKEAPEEVEKNTKHQEPSQHTIYASEEVSIVGNVTSPKYRDSTAEQNLQEDIRDSGMQMDKEIKILVRDDKAQQQESEDEEDDLSIDGEVTGEGAVNPAAGGREWCKECREFQTVTSAAAAADSDARAFNIPQIICDYYDEASDELRPGGTPPMILSSSHSSIFISSLPSSEMSWDTPGAGFITQASVPNWSTEISAWSTISLSRSSLDVISLASHSPTPDCASPTPSAISLQQPSAPLTGMSTNQQTTVTEVNPPALGTSVLEPWSEVASSLQSSTLVPSREYPISTETLLMQRASTSGLTSETSMPVGVNLLLDYAKGVSEVSVLQSPSPLASRKSSVVSSPLEATSDDLGSTTQISSGMLATSSRPSSPTLESHFIFRPQSPLPDSAPCDPPEQFASPPLSPLMTPSASRGTSPCRSLTASQAASVAQSASPPASPPSSASSPSPSQDFVQKVSRTPENVNSSNMLLYAALPAALRALEGVKPSEALGMGLGWRDPDLHSIVEEDEMVSSGTTSVIARLHSASSSGSSPSDHFLPGDSSFGNIDVSYSCMNGVCECNAIEGNRDWSTETTVSGSISEGEGDREKDAPSSPKDHRCAHSAPASPHASGLPLAVLRTSTFVAPSSASTVESSKTGGTDTVTGTDPATGSDSVLPLSVHSSLSWESSPTWANGSGCVTSSEAFRKFLGFYKAEGLDLTSEADTSFEDPSASLSASSSSSSPSPSPDPNPTPNTSVTVIV